jgi:hypothetical protein
MLYLYGTIGYSILLDQINNTKIIIFADMHDNLPLCKFPNSIKIAKWFQSKFKTSKILLEEVERTNNYKYKSLWNAEHTIDLKNLFINNSNLIEAIDIRPKLIIFSWELLDSSKDITYTDVILIDYFSIIESFFAFKHELFNNKIKLFILNHKKLLIHLNYIKNKFILFKKKYNNLLTLKLIDIYNSNKNLLEYFNIILNDCMEWYICYLIFYYKYKYKTIIVHAGLYHTDKINKILSKFYKYKYLSKQGIIDINDNINLTSCQPINDVF